MSSQQITPDPRYSHPLKKYDKRVNNGKNFDVESTPVKRGRKPKTRLEISGRKATTYVREMDTHKTPVQMFQEALEARNYALAWTIRCDVETRALGRPYVAINPDEQRHDQADISRIAVAINNLQIVNNPKQGTKPVIQAVTEQRMIPSGDTALEAQVALESTNGGECGILPSESQKPIQAGAKATPVR